MLCIAAGIHATWQYVRGSSAWQEHRHISNARLAVSQAVFSCCQACSNTTQDVIKCGLGVTAIHQCRVDSMGSVHAGHCLVADSCMWPFTCNGNVSL